MQIVHNIENTL